MKKPDYKAEQRNVLPMMNRFDCISPAELDDIMEWLEDKKYLSSKGKDFKLMFWNLFIKK